MGVGMILCSLYHTLACQYLSRLVAEGLLNRFLRSGEEVSCELAC
jgi:hypothetical protein